MSWLLSNNKYFAWFTYILAIIINMLILVGYGHSDYRAPEVSTLLFVLHCCAVWCAFCLRRVLQVKWVTISLMIVHVASAGLILIVMFYTRAPSANAKRCESPALCQTPAAPALIGTYRSPIWSRRQVGRLPVDLVPSRGRSVNDGDHRQQGVTPAPTKHAQDQGRPKEGHYRAAPAEPRDRFLVAAAHAVRSPLPISSSALTKGLSFSHIGPVMS